MSENAQVSRSLDSAGDADNWDHLETIHGDLLFAGCVLISGKEKQLKLMNNGIILGAGANKTSSKKKEALSLSWRDVICAVRDLKSPPGHKLSSFTLHYIDHKPNNKLRARTLLITDKDGHADKWINAINENCQKGAASDILQQFLTKSSSHAKFVSGRPKKAFVIVNPIGGARRGRQIYQKTVAPLFDLAGMQTTVTFTERSKHGLELGEHQDFSGYDVIVIVGGDGLQQEVLHGLTLQTQKKAGVDYNNPDSTFSKPDIPFGIIPAGTGNGLTQWCNGTGDEVTTVLNIIRGESLKTQILTVHSCGKFVTLCGILFGYGELSDLMKVTDDRRWMGRLRYPYSIFGMLLKKPRMFNCDIEYRKADKQEKQNDVTSSGASSDQEAEWTAYTGYSGPVCGFLSLTSETIEDGEDIILNIQGKCVDLFVNFGCSRVDLWKTIYKFIANGKNGAGPLPDKLERISRITGFRIKIARDVTENDETISAARARARGLEQLLNIDGEVVHVDKPELDIRVHSEFVTLYGCLKSPDAAKAK